MRPSIHHTALIDNTVHLGDDVQIGAFTSIRGRVQIGRGTIIESYVSIGAPPEHGSEKFDFKPACNPTGQIVIGEECVIREFTTVNKPMAAVTMIGNRAYVMARSHVSHDNFIEDDVVLATNACLGGWSKVLKGAYVGLGAITHQRTTLGQYCIVAAGAVVVKDVPSFAKYIPSKPLGVNDKKISLLGLCEFSTDREPYKSMLVEFHAKRDKTRPCHEYVSAPARQEQAQQEFESEMVRAAERQRELERVRKEELSP